MNKIIQSLLLTFLLAIGEILLISCSQRGSLELSASDPVPTFRGVDDNNGDDVNLNPQRSIEEAILIAKSIQNGDGLRTRCDDSEFDVDVVLSNGSLRSNSDASDIIPVDTILYILNKKNNGGVVVVWGDKRVSELLLYTDSGHLDKDEVIDNFGFAVYLSRLPIYYIQKVKEYDSRQRNNDNSQACDSLLDGDSPGISCRFEYTNWETKSEVKPLIKVTWSQGYPYNDCAPLINGKRAVAGCVAIAAAQFTSYYHYPISFKGIDLDWDYLNKYSSFSDYFNDDYQKYAKQVSQYLRTIGDELGNSWGTTGTKAYTGNIVSMLRNMGYKNPSDLTPYFEQGLINSIKQLRPVIMRGNSERGKEMVGWWIFKHPKTIYKGGHAWLVDGLVVQERERKTIDNNTNKVIASHIENRIFVHCNWGWGGLNDGYFTPGVFDSNHPTILSDAGEETNIPDYYQY